MSRSLPHFCARLSGIALALALVGCHTPTALVAIGSTYRAVAYNAMPLPAMLPSIQRWDARLEDATYTFTSSTTLRVNQRVLYHDRQTDSVFVSDTEIERTYRQVGRALTIHAGPCLAIFSCIDDRGTFDDRRLIVQFDADPAQALLLERVP